MKKKEVIKRNLRDLHKRIKYRRVREKNLWKDQKACEFCKDLLFEMETWSYQCKLHDFECEFHYICQDFRKNVKEYCV